MGMLYQRGRKGIWWIKFYRAGKPFYESSRSTVKRVAKDLLALREGQIADGRFVGTRADKVRFNDMADNLVNDYKVNRRRSLSSAERITKRLKAFFGNRRAAEITTADVRAYIANRQAEYACEPCQGHADGERCPKCDRRTAPATIMNELAALKRIFNLALQAGEIHHKPYIPHVQVDNVRKGFLGEIEYLAMREALPGPLKPVLDFGYWTAWRKQEILGLTWDRVDLAAGTVRLDPGTTKNRTGRTIVLTDSLRAILRRLWDETRALTQQQGRPIPWVFHRDGEPIKSMEGAWRAARKTAGLPNLFFHDLRRTGVRNMIRAGVTEKVAMTISGHKTRAVFDRYDIVSETDLQEAARKVEAHLRGGEPVTESVTVPLRPGHIPPHSNQDTGEQGDGRTA
jgi:integrase